MTAPSGIFSMAMLAALVVVGACVAARPAGDTPPADPAVTPTALAASAQPPAGGTSVPGSGAGRPVEHASGINGAWWVWDDSEATTYHLALDAAGSAWRLTRGAPTGSQVGAGTFTFGDGVLTWQEGWFDCAPDAMGSYEPLLSADDERLTFAVVGDECASRQERFATWSAWQRFRPPGSG